MGEPVVGVCGFGRCGSTMVMSMLAAGGVPPVADADPLSHERDVAGTAGLTAGDLAGRTIKLLDQALYERLPTAGLDWRFVWCSRNHVEQARSAVKLMRALGATPGPTTKVRLAYSYRDDGPRLRRRLARIGPVLQLPFEEAIAEPLTAACRLAEFVAPQLRLDMSAAAAAVHQRDPACLPDLAFEMGEVPHG